MTTINSKQHTHDLTAKQLPVHVLFVMRSWSHHYFTGLPKKRCAVPTVSRETVTIKYSQHTVEDARVGGKYMAGGTAWCTLMVKKGPAKHAVFGFICSRLAASATPQPQIHLNILLLPAELMLTPPTDLSLTETSIDPATRYSVRQDQSCKVSPTIIDQSRNSNRSRKLPLMVYSPTIFIDQSRKSIQSVLYDQSSIY